MELTSEPSLHRFFFIRGDARGHAPLRHEDEVIVKEVIEKEVMVLAHLTSDNGESSTLKVMFFDRVEGVAYWAGAW